MELFKLSAQALLVAVAGGFLVQEYTRRRERESATNEFKRQLLTDLVHAYSKAKRARRSLRASLRSADPEASTQPLVGSLPREEYRTQMINLGEAQTELEMLVHQLNTFLEYFEDARPIRNSVQGMQRYLDSLTDEYENASSRAEGEGLIDLGGLRVLPEFLASTSESEFRKRFTRRFQAALSEIQRERLRLD
jgi:hypothetical protein